MRYKPAAKACRKPAERHCPCGDIEKAGTFISEVVMSTQEIKRQIKATDNQISQLRRQRDNTKNWRVAEQIDAQIAELDAQGLERFDKLKGAQGEEINRALRV